MFSWREREREREKREREREREDREIERERREREKAAKRESSAPGTRGYLILQDVVLLSSRQEGILLATHQQQTDEVHIGRIHDVTAHSLLHVHWNATTKRRERWREDCRPGISQNVSMCSDVGSPIEKTEDAPLKMLLGRDSVKGLNIEGSVAGICGCGFCMDCANSLRVNVVNRGYFWGSCWERCLWARGNEPGHCKGLAPCSRAGDNQGAVA